MWSVGATANPVTRLLTSPSPSWSIHIQIDIAGDDFKKVNILLTWLHPPQPTLCGQSSILQGVWREGGRISPNKLLRQSNKRLLPKRRLKSRAHLHVPYKWVKAATKLLCPLFATKDILEHQTWNDFVLMNDGTVQVYEAWSDLVSYPIRWSLFL